MDIEIRNPTPTSHYINQIRANNTRWLQYWFLIRDSINMADFIITLINLDLLMEGIWNEDINADNFSKKKILHMRCHQWCFNPSCFIQKMIFATSCAIVWEQMYTHWGLTIWLKLCRHLQIYFVDGKPFVEIGLGNGLSPKNKRKMVPKEIAYNSLEFWKINMHIFPYS